MATCLPAEHAADGGRRGQASTNDTGATLGPVAMSQGASGTKAPAANVTSEESAEAHGEPSSAGFTPSTARE